MANRKLNSIKFPDIADTYILDADKVNYDDSETYASGSVGKELQKKADASGAYPDLTAGTANQINTSVRANDKTPYLFRTSGGSVDIGDREYVNGIVGGTVAWNQLVPISNIRSRSIGGMTFTNNQDGSVSISGTCTATDNYSIISNSVDAPVGHKLYYGGIVGTSNYGVGNASITTINEGVDGVIKECASNASVNVLCLRVISGATINIKVYPKVIDLTQMFGSTIADYIYSLETATAGAGVAWFKKLFPKPYYEYNTGELKSVSGLISHDMTGFNQWDEEWEAGQYNITTGEKAYHYTAVRSKNYIKVLPNTTYYLKNAITNNAYILFYDENKTYIPSPVYENDQTFTTPSNCRYITFWIWNATTYSEGICINLAWDNSRNGEYEPYEKRSYPLDSDLTLRGIPKLDADNKLYYDGDTYSSDGAVMRKYGVRAYQSGDESLEDAITDGTNTVYKLTTPTTETADPYTNPQIVDDFGTEEYVISDSVFAVPVGHDTDYPINMAAKLEMAPNSPSGDGDYIVRQTNGTNEYVSLAGNATIQDIISRLEALENA